jgi:hypothetical protein
VPGHGRARGLEVSLPPCWTRARHPRAPVDAMDSLPVRRARPPAEAGHGRQSGRATVSARPPRRSEESSTFGSPPFLRADDGTPARRPRQGISPREEAAGALPSGDASPEGSAVVVGPRRSSSAHRRHRTRCAHWSG